MHGACARVPSAKAAPTGRVLQPMARSAKVKPTRTGQQRPALGRSLAVHALAAALFLGMWAAGLWMLSRHVATRVAFPADPPRVVLKNRPAWMSDYLADGLCNLVRPRAAYSALDRRLLEDAVLQLSHNPWIRKVNRVSRRFGSAPGDTLEIDCEYRAPVALVASGGRYWLVDGEGVKLPESFRADEVERIQYGRNGKVNIRVIEGVRGLPPADGRHWAGEDLAAGLDMVKLLHGHEFTEEILAVDVSHFANRGSAEPAISLVTRYGSRLKWGEPPAAAFHAELPPAVKLSRIAAIKQQYGRVDAHRSWLDIRFERITYPIEESPVVQAGHRR